MNRDQMIIEIEYACKAIQANDKAMGSLGDVIGCNPDSALWESVFRLQDSVVKQTAKLIGDTDGWLAWFVYENECGAKGMQAKAAAWTALRKIKTAADLAKLIEASR